MYAIHCLEFLVFFHHLLCQSVISQIWHCRGIKTNFSKIRIDPVMLKFLAITENTILIGSEDSTQS